MLLLLMMYIYAVAGVIYFGENDPWHFGTIGIAMVTLTRVVILDAWTQVFYINYYGCKYYSNGLYYNDEDINDAADTSEYIGGRCNDNPQPVVTCAILLSFIFVAAFCVLALIIGAVGMAMFDSMAELKAEEQHRTEEHIANEIAKPGPKDRVTRKALEYLQLAMNGHRLTLRTERGVTFKILYHYFFDQDRVQAQNALNRYLSPYRNGNSFVNLYKMLCDTCATIADDSYFAFFINAIILYVSVMAGLQTVSYVEEKYEPYQRPLELVVAIIFSFEVFVKVMAEDENHFLYFRDSWNWLDFIVVVFSWISFLPSNLVMLVRMVRLMRVVKLMRTLPELQNMAEAMFDGVVNVLSIGVLLFIYLMVSGYIGMSLFGQNDHYRFSSLSRAMITMFQMSTFDAWADALYTNAYGCDRYGYNEFLCDTDDPNPRFYAAVVFFTINLVLGGLVMLTLFVGVMSISLEDRHDQLNATMESEKELDWLAFHFGLTRQDVAKYRRIFNFIDISGSRKIEEIELRVAIRLAQVNKAHHEKMFNKIKRREEDDYIDFATFLRYMMMLREEHLQRKYGVWHPVLIGGELSDSSDDENSGTWRESNSAYTHGKVELSASHRFKAALGLA